MIETHVCNCKYCDKKSSCLVCGTKNDIDRAHIIPRYLVQFLPKEFDDEKKKWLSFDGTNLIPLCGEHHKDFDLFRLSYKQMENIRPLLAIMLGRFAQMLKGTTANSKVVRKFELYVGKQSAWLEKLYGENIKTAESNK